VPIDEMQGEDALELSLLMDLHDRARSYLLGQKWCFGIGETYFGDGIGRIVGIFLMEMKPLPTKIDPWLWVIVGGLPSAYLVIDTAPTPVEALRTYISLMREWVELAYQGRGARDVIPVNVPPTPEYAAMLESRLDVLDRWAGTIFTEQRVQ
jgi:hypothetical protein